VGCVTKSQESPIAQKKVAMVFVCSLLEYLQNHKQKF